MMNDEATLEIQTTEFLRYLNTLLPRTASYRLRLALLQAVAHKHASFPVRLYAYLRRLSRRRPHRPFFIGTSVDGIRFLGDFCDSYSVASAVVPHYNGAVLRFIQQEARKTRRIQNGIVFDIGANVGITTVALARALKEDTMVVAVEPAIETAYRAAATFALNGVTNVRLLCNAASNENGTATFFNVPGQSAISSLHRTEHLQAHRRVHEATTVTCTLDSWMGKQEGGVVTFMKIDVEGHELSVLQGARKLIQRSTPRILLEYNPHTLKRAGWKGSDVNAFLNSLAPYSLLLLRDDGMLERFLPESEHKGRLDLYCVPTSEVETEWSRFERFSLSISEAS